MTTGGTFRTILPEEISRAHEMEVLGKSYLVDFTFLLNNINYTNKKTL